MTGQCNEVYKIDKDITLPNFLIMRTCVDKVVATTSSGDYVRLYIMFNFQRNSGYFLIQSLLPAALIVIVSWIAFWISRDSPPSRTSLGVMTVLAMTHLLTGVNRRLPPVNYVKAADIYLGFCYLMVAFSLFEYAAVAFSKRRNENKKKRENKKGKVQYDSVCLKPTLPDPGHDVRLKILQNFNEESIDHEICTCSQQPVTSLLYLSRKSNKLKPYVKDSHIDRAARIIFPVTFSLFNVIFWLIVYNELRKSQIEEIFTDELTFSLNNIKMSEKSDLVKCKEMVLYKFKLDDLRSCLHGLFSNASGKKDDLQRRLRTFLESDKTQNKAIDVIFERGLSMGYITKSRQGGFVDNEPTPKYVPRSSNRQPTLETNILMKDLYFYKDVHNVTGWKIINANDVSQSVFLNFILSKDLTKSLVSSKESKEPSRSFFLRCANIKQETQSAPLKDCYPVLMRMFINGQEFTSLLPREICYSSVDRKNRLPVPTVLNEALVKISHPFNRDVPIKVELRYDRDANKNESFAFAIFIAYSKTVEEICKEITSRKKVTFEKFDSDLKKFMSNTGDVALECARIPLRSSITYQTIRIPFRGKNCNHISPDDLKDYIEINKNSESWLCKICKHVCTPNDIMVDEFFMDVLKKHPTIDGIELYPGMKYKLYGGSEILSFGESTSATKKNDDVSIVLIDSDDEFSNISSCPSASGRIFKDELKHSTTNNVNNCSSKNIECIVINDSSDEEPPQKRTRDEEIHYATNDFSNLDSSLESFTLENEVISCNNLNSNVNGNIGFIPDITISNDSFQSDQLTETNDSSNIQIEKLPPNHTENCSLKKSTTASTSGSNIKFNIEKLSENFNNSNDQFDGLLNGFTDNKVHNIDKILDQEVKNGILPENHLDLQNTINVSSMFQFIAQDSPIQQYFASVNNEMSNLKDHISEINNMYK
ncbi:SAP domain and Zinc finger, MIZ-type domain and Gamma-aminobutyric acid A receptor/Glycine receptor alpha family and Neurotransmitter-gated ion-channel transmembrane domain-containing protein [Strongyloides ratti]|uniref:SAP domain and Zinc finger, MIZ-type domain and Gamma-aminobutyric acid A receptor/Glycine receptor alpha family and Neurotransmitter-gated ion-channel transmembrane domain-containing protein n=1 Tax=Strongyloides ratti TaxID=34506 RepID=A0A090LJI5_STRRB|nr:SAP domain and Zinc finger, MIZ-type domain and Gamma-aminobutyric acid A receptor/Glycine receptor alpha family and Neurotransmitter-gated ion-channel transmembrane domain-containing protein [Strongyloides ratti]CEF68278.1 SAP domain and Zinc finger, MIZ-type domain and Gamma-aminobutyric acid A receptor/Glycine receptor alpha family and Neurotransmitter-gated ion-channel transmembrane domain-containing protein [Strongyloides ratti]